LLVIVLAEAVQVGVDGLDVPRDVCALLQLHLLSDVITDAHMDRLTARESSAEVELAS